MNPNFLKKLLLVFISSFLGAKGIAQSNHILWYNQPADFLEESLVLGNGKMETSMGATYFVKGEPIDFENIKYKFSTVDCVGK